MRNYEHLALLIQKTLNTYGLDVTGSRLIDIVHAEGVANEESGLPLALHAILDEGHILPSSRLNLETMQTFSVSEFVIKMWLWKKCRLLFPFNNDCIYYPLNFRHDFCSKGPIVFRDGTPRFMNDLALALNKLGYTTYVEYGANSKYLARYDKRVSVFYYWRVLFEFYFPNFVR